MSIGLFGETLFRNNDLQQIDYDKLFKVLKRPYVNPQYRISVLNPDETVDYVIPSEDIPSDGISFTEEYQNGQRRNITLKLINKNNKYTPSVNGIWLTTKFSYEVGIALNSGTIVWFPKGVYVMGNVDLTHGNSDRTISIQLKDKFALFEGKMGALETDYEIEVGSDIYDAVKGILNFDRGDGYILDCQNPIFDQSFQGQKTKTTIRAESGDTLSTLIDALATQLSAEYYYNNVGNLCFFKINETIDDSSKPIIWVYENLGRDLHNMSLNYNNDDIINVVKVVGDNVDYGVYFSIAKNENPVSPICIQQVGKRIAPKYSESNIWSNDLANDLAKYYLRKSSFISVSFTTNVSFNPILTVNNICEIENQDMSLGREKLLITSISYSSPDGLMQINFTNTKDLPFIKY